MAGISITIDGLGEAQGLLDVVQDKIKSGIAKGLAEVGEIVVKDAKASCPVDTTNLRESIEKSVGESECEVGTNVEYGGYVEFGTYKMAAQPYLVPALLDNEDAIRQTIADAVTGEL